MENHCVRLCQSHYHLARVCKIQNIWLDAWAINSFFFRFSSLLRSAEKWVNSLFVVAKFDGIDGKSEANCLNDLVSVCGFSSSSQWLRRLSSLPGKSSHTNYGLNGHPLLPATTENYHKFLINATRRSHGRPWAEHFWLVHMEYNGGFVIPVWFVDSLQQINGECPFRLAKAIECQVNGYLADTRHKTSVLIGQVLYKIRLHSTNYDARATLN